MTVRFVLAAATLGLAASLLAQPAGVRPKPVEWPDKPKQGSKLSKEGPAGAMAQFDAIRRGPLAPAATPRSSWMLAREVPLWADRGGVSPHWECIGPAPIVEGWGGSTNSGRVSSIAVDPRDPNRVYCAPSFGGVWKSTNGGRNWKPIADSEASLSMGSICLDPFDPDVILVGTGEAHGSFDSYFGAGILRSTDAGRTWECMGEEDFHGAVIAQLCASKKIRGMYFAATGKGLYRSLDGGRYWEQMLAGGFQDVVNSLRQPDTFYACGGTAVGRKHGVFKTTDDGNTWELLTGGLPEPLTFGRTQLAQCRDYPNTVYVSFAIGRGNGMEIYRTDSGGQHWRLLQDAPNYGGGQSWYDNFLACKPDDPNVVLGGGLTVYRTKDGGLTWSDCARSYAGGNTHPDWHSYCFDPSNPNVMYGGSDGGLWVTRDAGDTWEGINDGLAITQFVGMDVDPFDQYVAYGGSQDNGTERTRGSLGWKWIMGGDGGTTLVDFEHPNRVYTEYVNLIMYRSDNYGDGWDWAAGDIDRSGAGFYAPFELDPNNSDILVAGASRVWRTTDRTNSWTAVSGYMGTVTALAIAPHNSDVIYAGNSWGQLRVTPNAGKDWYDITAGTSGRYVTCVAVDPRSPRRVFAATGGHGNQHLFFSENAGGSWKCVDDNLPDAPVSWVAIDRTRPDDVYIAMDCGVFVSNTGGGHWKRYGIGLPNTVCVRLALNRRTGYLTVATHGRSMWRVPLPDMKEQGK